MLTFDDLPIGTYFTWKNISDRKKIPVYLKVTTERVRITGGLSSFNVLGYLADHEPVLVFRKEEVRDIEILTIPECKI